MATDERTDHARIDSRRTPLSEWLFMIAAVALVLVGLPVLLAVIFHFAVPFIGRIWSA